MATEPDVFEDLPFPNGVKMVDWAGVDWTELSQARVEYITARRRTKRGKIVEFLDEIAVGEGRKRDNIPNFKTAKGIRNMLYRAAVKAWGKKSIKIEVTHDEQTDTYTVEFVHLPPEEDGKNNTRTKTKIRKQEEAKDELHALCLEYGTPTVTAAALYNVLKRGDINTLEELRNASLADIAAIRDVGKEKLAVITAMQGRGGYFLLEG